MKRTHPSTGLLGRSTRSLSCKRVAWVSLTPFLAALLVGSLVFRRGSGSAFQESVVQRPRPARVLEETLPCYGSNCELQGGSSAPAAAAGGAAVAAAAGASSAARGDLPKLFLFIGILSGRGYRHRRLAVREAWSNKAQVPGEVVSKFILSEDERTPQVRRQLPAAVQMTTLIRALVRLNMLPACSWMHSLHLVRTFAMARWACHCRDHVLPLLTPEKGRGRRAEEPLGMTCPTWCDLAAGGKGVGGLW